MGGGLKLEFEFPEPIIQHIQSFLTGEEATRTSILSKSWYNAWLTLPYLDFDESVFFARGFSESGYSKYVKNTIDWYEQLNIKIESLKLCMSTRDFSSAYLANSLIVKALGELDATRLNFQLNDGKIVLPHQVLFGSDNLVELSVQRHVQGYCEIKHDGMETKCSKLESLCLNGVHTTSSALPNLFSCCPLLENLSLCNIIYDYGYEERRRLRVPPRPPVGVRNSYLERLRCVVLCYKSFEILFPGDLLSKFPSLADLTIHRMLELHAQEEDVQISNRSLQRLKIEAGIGSGRGLRIKLDVPSIRKFTFESCGGIPWLSFVSPSTRGWESHVSITRKAGLTVSWFHELNEFLTQLWQSKIHLSLSVQCLLGFDYQPGDVSVIHKHELENLTIDTTGLPSCFCYFLFDGLFRLCRPKLITQTQKKEDYYPHQNASQYPIEYPPHSRDQRKINNDLLCQVLDQGIHLKVSVPRQLMYGLNDLEEANAQIFDDDAMSWRPPIPLKSLLLLLEDLDQQQGFRLLLKWKP